jgi:hypothetical protein
VAERVSLAEVEARNFAGEGGEVPENVEQVVRPLPPVGHFGYTEEDAEAVREDNKAREATVDGENTAAETAAAEVEVEESGRGPGVSRSSDGSATKDHAVANVADSGTAAGEKRRARRESAVQQAPAGQSRSGSQPDE